MRTRCKNLQNCSGVPRTLGPLNFIQPSLKLNRHDATDSRKLMMELADWISSDLSESQLTLSKTKPRRSRPPVERWRTVTSQTQHQLHSEAMVWHDPFASTTSQWPNLPSTWFLVGVATTQLLLSPSGEYLYKRIPTPLHVPSIIKIIPSCIVRKA